MNLPLPTAVASAIMAMGALLFAIGLIIAVAALSIHKLTWRERTMIVCGSLIASGGAYAFCFAVCHAQ